MAVSTIGTGGDYTTIEAWEATLSGTFTEDQEGALFNEVFSPINGFGFGGFTTASNAKLIIRAATAAETGGASAKHNGTAGSGARITKTGGGGWGVIYSTDANVKHWIVKDLEIYSNGAGNIGVFINNTSWDYGVAENCIVHDFAGGAFEMFKAATGATAQVINCAAWNLTGAVYGVRGVSTDTARVAAYHCTMIADDTDDDRTGAGFRYVMAINCVACHFGPTGGYADFMALDAGSSNNASSDTSGNIDNVIAANQFVSVGGTWDLHLKSGSGLEAAGTSIVSVTTDFEGDARDVSTPDIGFDEYAAIGGSTSFMPRPSRPLRVWSNFA